MVEIYKRNELAAGLKAEEDYFPNEEDVHQKVEQTYSAAFAVLESDQIKHEPHVRYRVTNPAVVAEVKSRLFNLFYIHVLYQRGKFHLENESLAHLAKAALDDAENISKSLDAISPELISLFLAQQGRRATIFSKTSRQSLGEFLDFCARRTLLPPKPKGRKSDDISHAITADAVELFQHWVQRSFTWNLSTLPSADGDETDFEGGDASCVRAILIGVDPSLTTARIRTSLKQVRKSSGQKSHQTVSNS